MFGWMGIPDGDEFYQPTLAHGWIHQMTCPRELTLQQDRLLQRPARELQQLRGAQRRLQGAAQQLETLDIASAELLIAPEGALTAHFGDALRLDYRRGAAPFAPQPAQRPAGGSLLARRAAAAAYFLRSLQHRDLYQ